MKKPLIKWFETLRSGKWSHLLLYAGILGVPFVVDPHFANPFVLPKIYWCLACLGAVGINYLFSLSQAKKTYYFSSAVTTSLIVYIGAIVFSSFVSMQPATSWWGGREWHLMSVLSVVTGALMYFLLTQYVRNVQQIKWLRTSLSVVLIAAATYFVGMVLGSKALDVVWQRFGFTTVEELLTSFGWWAVVLGTVAAGTLYYEKNTRKELLIHGAALVATMSVLLLLNSSLIWWFWSGALLTVVAVGEFIRSSTSRLLTLLYLVMSIVGGVAAYTGWLTASLVPLTEVGLGFLATWDIVWRTITAGAKQFFLGGGLGAFPMLFTQYRDASFNFDPFWSVRFVYPASTIMGLIAEGGVVVAGAFVFAVSTIMRAAWRALRVTQPVFGKSLVVAPRGLEHGVENTHTTTPVVAWFVATVGLALVHVGVAGWMLWWTLTALVVVVLQAAGFLSGTTALVDFSKKKMVLGVRIGLLTIIVVGGVFGSIRMRAEYLFAQARTEADVVERIALLEKATALRPREPVYHVALAESYLARIAALPPGADGQQAVVLLAQKAVAEASRATELRPRDVRHWEFLARVYREFSTSMYDALLSEENAWRRAEQLDPSNPAVAFEHAVSLEQLGKQDEALAIYTRVLTLKPDFSLAALRLAMLYEGRNEIDRAFEVYVTLFRLTDPAPAPLTHYGRLLYNRNNGNDREQAMEAWRAALVRNPDYTEAIRSLALAYDEAHDTTAALQYYQKLKTFFPDDAELQKTIQRLERK